jgi:hypothetical protein
MKIHTTNYTNTFIEVAEDSPATKGEIPPSNGDLKSVARIQYDILIMNPYKFTSDDVLFQVYAERNDITQSERMDARKQFFSKGQPCFRASPLTKRYGWGIHSDKDGKIAIYGVESDAYKKFSTDRTLKTVKAMRSKRK